MFCYLVEVVFAFLGQVDVCVIHWCPVSGLQAVIVVAVFFFFFVFIFIGFIFVSGWWLCMFEVEVMFIISFFDFFVEIL